MPKQRHNYTCDHTPIVVVPADLISTSEVARILGVDRATVIRRARHGRIPIVAQLDSKTSGALVFSRSDVIAYENRKSPGGANE